jgi:ribosomal protein L11 methyltransferase
VESEQVQWYQEISVTVMPDDEEAVANYIIENIASGLLFENEEDNQHTVIRFYLDAELDADSKLNELEKYLSSINSSYADISLHKKKLKNLDWIEAYKKSVTPVEVGNNIVIKPPWAKESFSAKTEIILEPKMAFGTGRHESTKGCLLEMERMNLQGKTVLDLGCGSGVLSIYAALKGARAVVGYDTDPLAIENSRENFEINKVEKICSANVGNIDSVPDGETFDLVAVNIIKAVIVPIIGQLKTHLRPKGNLLLAGLLQRDKDEIDAALYKHGLRDFTTYPDAEWITYNVTVE